MGASCRRHPPARLPRPARKHFAPQAPTHPPAPPPTLPPHFTPQPPPPPPAVPPLPSLASQSRVRACGCVRAGECARARPRPLVRACPCLRAWRVRVRVPVSTFAFVCTCRPPAQRRAAGTCLAGGRDISAGGTRLQDGGEDGAGGVAGVERRDAVAAAVVHRRLPGPRLQRQHLCVCACVRLCVRARVSGCLRGRARAGVRVWECARGRCSHAACAPPGVPARLEGAVVDCSRLGCGSGKRLG